MTSQDLTLGDLLRAAKLETGLGLGDLTVLSAQNDPYRLDTESFHRAGQWLRDRMDETGLLTRERPIHNRGIFYAIVARGDVLLPNGSKFINDDPCWSSRLARPDDLSLHNAMQALAIGSTARA
jgi:hypothetical protein